MSHLNVIRAYRWYCIPWCIARGSLMVNVNSLNIITILLIVFISSAILKWLANAKDIYSYQYTVAEYLSLWGMIIVLIEPYTKQISEGASLGIGLLLFGTGCLHAFVALCYQERLIKKRR